MVTGELATAIAMTEPGTGSDLQAVRTFARRDGDEYVINGAKTFITNGQHANLIIVVAKTDREAGAKGTSLLLVETDKAGLPPRPQARQGGAEGAGHLASCSSTTCACRRPTCWAARKARASSS
jgi:alkylation response protein AidB-like acyl-CoA dehydrogenase